jgi:hypothetical protein
VRKPAPNIGLLQQGFHSAFLGVEMTLIVFENKDAWDAGGLRHAATAYNCGIFFRRR